MSANRTYADLTNGAAPQTAKLLKRDGLYYQLGYGAVVPTTDTDWGQNALFIQTDGSTNARWYVNTAADGATCTFSAIATAENSVLTTGNQTIAGDKTFSGVIAMGNTAHDGLLAGAGTSATKYTMTGASKSALSYYVSTADTADSNRCAYLRIYLTGNGSGGEAIRGFATGSGVGMSALRGAHISASIAGSGTITGEMHAIKGTTHVPNTNLAGTNAGIHSEIYADGASSASTGTIAFFRGSLGGTAGGVTTLNGQVAMVALDGITIGSAGDGKVVDAISGDKAVTHLAKILLNGSPYYIMLRNAV